MQLINRDSRHLDNIDMQQCISKCSFITSASHHKDVCPLITERKDYENTSFLGMCWTCDTLFEWEM